MTTSDLPINEVVQGDCLEILKTLPDQCVDLIFADPPYNLQLRSELIRPNETVVDAVKDAWDQFESFAEYDAFTRAWLTECRRVLKDTGTLWVIGSYHNIFRVGAALMDLGYWMLNSVHWCKTNPMPNFLGTRFTNATETLIWAKKSEAQKSYTFNYQAMKNFDNDDGKQMQNLWYIPLCMGAERIKINGKKAHSTQKPEALLYRVILSSSNPDDIVLDPFFGTGTTGAVAKKLKRRFIGIEREPRYVSLARQRIDSITNTDIHEDLLITPSRRSLPRVSFGYLLAAQYLGVGQRLFSRDRKHEAVIKADSHLICGDFTGSIHQAAARCQERGKANGWDFWHFEEDDTLTSIDQLRERYRKEYGLPELVR